MSPSEFAAELRDAGASGDNGHALHDLVDQVYDELRVLAAKYLRAGYQGSSLEPTALVHEAFLRLVDQTQVDWKGRSHFFAVAAQAMRRVLIDHARRRAALKRGGRWTRVTLHDGIADLREHEVDALALDEALTVLADLDQRQARIVELRFFAGLTVEEAAFVLGVSPRTVELDWRMARAWLRTTLREVPPT